MSEQPKDGGPAFPTHAGADIHKASDDPTRDDPRNRVLGGGMSLRDYFAAQSLDGSIKAFWDADYTIESNAKEVAACAYAIADAMLKARGQ